MVITSALHAEGRQFNSGRNHAFFKTNTLCFFCSMFNREDGNSHFLIDSEISEISTRSASHFIAFVKYSRTPTNGHLSTTVIFFGGQSIHSLLFQTHYNGRFLLSSRCRLSHKLPMNPKKLKLPIKVSKSCQKVAEKLPKFFCFSYLFWVLKIKNSHIASYQNFICQSPMIIPEVLSISLDQQIVYQNEMNKTW